MRQLGRQALAQTTACYLLDSKPFSQSMNIAGQAKNKKKTIRLNFNYNTQMYLNQLNWISAHCLQIEAYMVSATGSSRSHRQQFIPAIVISLHSLRSWPKHSLSKPCTYGRRHNAIHVFDIQQADYTSGLKPVKSTIRFLNIYSLAPL